MEEGNKREFDMFDYIGRGNTMYDFIDRHLNGYLGGDFSLNSLVKHSRTFGVDIAPKYQRSRKEKEYQDVFSELTDKLILALDTSEEKSGEGKQMSEEEKQELLKKMQDLKPVEKLGSIEEYIKLVRNNNYTDTYYENLGYYSALNNIIIDAAVDTLSDEKKSEMKYMLFKYTYSAQVGNQLKQKYPDRDEKHYPEWKEYEFIIKTLSEDVSRFRKYDGYIQHYEDDMKSKSEEVAISMACKAKREQYVIREMVAGMTEEEQKDLMKEKTIESVVFKKPQNFGAKEGSYVWSIKPHSSPRVVLDTVAEYSKDGIENQKVIAISYGKFEYGTLIGKEGTPTLISDELELVGITRIGKDGSRNYFVLMPRIEDIMKKEHNRETKPNASNPLINLDNREVVSIETDLGLSDSLKDFYAKVALSDNCLLTAMYGNFKFAGRIKDDVGRPGIDATYMNNINDLEAACYASKYPGKTPDGKASTLEEYCKSAEFLARHFNILNLLQKSKEDLVKGVRKPTSEMLDNKTTLGKPDSIISHNSGEVGKSNMHIREEEALIITPSLEDSQEGRKEDKPKPQNKEIPGGDDIEHV